MIFFDQNDWFTQHARVKDLQKTQAKINHLDSEITRMNQQLNDLETNDAKIEKYAREKYHEKRDSEDVYLVIPDTVAVKGK